MLGLLTLAVSFESSPQVALTSASTRELELTPWAQPAWQTDRGQIFTQMNNFPDKVKLVLKHKL